MTARFLTDDLVMAIWRRGKPNGSADFFHRITRFSSGVPVGSYMALGQARQFSEFD